MYIWDLPYIGKNQNLIAISIDGEVKKGKGAFFEQIGTPSSNLDEVKNKIENNLNSLNSIKDISNNILEMVRKNEYTFFKEVGLCSFFKNQDNLALFKDVPVYKFFNAYFYNTVSNNMKNYSDDKGENPFSHLFRTSDINKIIEKTINELREGPVINNEKEFMKILENIVKKYYNEGQENFMKNINFEMKKLFELIIFPSNNKKIKQIKNDVTTIIKNYPYESDRKKEKDLIIEERQLTPAGREKVYQLIENFFLREKEGGVLMARKNPDIIEQDINLLKYNGLKASFSSKTIQNAIDNFFSLKSKKFLTVELKEKEDYEIISLKETNLELINKNKNNLYKKIEENLRNNINVNNSTKDSGDIQITKVFIQNIKNYIEDKNNFFNRITTEAVLNHDAYKTKILPKIKQGINGDDVYKKDKGLKGHLQECLLDILVEKGGKFSVESTGEAGSYLSTKLKKGYEQAHADSIFNIEINGKTVSVGVQSKNVNKVHLDYSKTFLTAEYSPSNLRYYTYNYKNNMSALDALWTIQTLLINKDYFNFNQSKIKSFLQMSFLTLIRYQAFYYGINNNNDDVSYFNDIKNTFIAINYNIYPFSLFLEQFKTKMDNLDSLYKSQKINKVNVFSKTGECLNFSYQFEKNFKFSPKQLTPKDLKMGDYLKNIGVI